MTDQTIHATPEQIAEAQRILANAAIPVQHAERVAEVTNGTRVGMTTDAVAQLIQDARGALGVTPAADPSIVEAASPEHVNALLAAQSDLKAIIDDATKKRAEIQKIFRDMLADADELQVNGATVATYKQAATKRVINLEHVEKLFPDTADNAELWTDKPGARTLIFK
jgi:hypothetical protein